MNNKIIELDKTEFYLEINPNQLKLLKNGIDNKIKIQSNYLIETIDNRGCSAYIIDESDSKGLHIHTINSISQIIIKLEELYRELTGNSTDILYLKVDEFKLHDIECIVDDDVIRMYKELKEIINKCSEKQIITDYLKKFKELVNKIVEFELLHKSIINLQDIISCKLSNNKKSERNMCLYE